MSGAVALRARARSESEEQQQLTCEWRDGIVHRHYVRTRRARAGVGQGIIDNGSPSGLACAVPAAPRSAVSILLLHRIRIHVALIFFVFLQRSPAKRFPIELVSVQLLLSFSCDACLPAVGELGSIDLWPYVRWNKRLVISESQRPPIVFFWYIARVDMS